MTANPALLALDCGTTKLRATQLAAAAGAPAP